MITISIPTLDGKSIPIFKSPKTDEGFKASAKGYLKVDKDEQGQFILIENVSKEDEETGYLETVFENGKLVKFQALSQIRELTKI